MRFRENQRTGWLHFPGPTESGSGWNLQSRGDPTCRTPQPESERQLPDASPMGESHRHNPQLKRKLSKGVSQFQGTY